jgi:hypothetical protein
MVETLKYDRKHMPIRHIYLDININHVQRFREVLHNAEINPIFTDNPEQQHSFLCLWAYVEL